MRSSSAEINQNEERLREYQRQQERLKAMAMNADRIKSVSADVMIENLLKQNFVKPINKTVDNKSNSRLGLPNWLECESPEVPGPYKHLWTLVKTASNYADTQKVSQLLLTSGLQTEVLGYIWNISNNVVPGQLNKQEFYIVLALVALAQSGYTFNNLSILNFIPTAPIPALQTKVIENYGQQQNMLSSCSVNDVGQIGSLEEAARSEGISVPKFPDYSFFNSPTFSTFSESLKSPSDVKCIKRPSKISSSQEFSSIENDKDFTKKSNFPLIGSSPTAELEDEDDFSEFQSAFVIEPIPEITIEKKVVKESSQLDEFTDFQCADINVDPLETVVINQKKEIPKIPLPRSLTGKISNLRTNILKISPESEKKLKVLTQSETLSSLPESKISTNNIVSTMPNISVLGGSRDVGMRLAHHSLGSRTEKIKHQRHHRHKQPTHGDDMHFSSKFGSIDELFPKCFQKGSGGSKTFVLKETKIGNIDAPEPEALPPDYEASSCPYQSIKNTRKIEIPMVGTFNETMLPTQADNAPPCQQPTVELFSVEEDKYSALREVELEMKLKNSQSQDADSNSNVNTPDNGDDFGEFLSVDIPPSATTEETDLWGEWNNNDLDPQPNVDSGSDSQKPSEDLNSINIENIQNSVRDHNVENSADTNITLEMDLLNLNEENCMKTLGPDIDCTVEVSEDGLKTNCPLTSRTEPLGVKADRVEENIQEFEDFIMLDNLKRDENYVPNTSNLQTTILTDKNAISEDFGIFFTSEFSTASPEINADDLLPSLDLNIIPSEANANEIRKKCLTACLNLMQQALEIFNGVTSSSVLQEVFSTEEAINYLNSLNVINHISKRTSSNCYEGSGIQEEIERIWQKLKSYCKDYNIRLKSDVERIASVGAQCYVCLGFIGSDIIEQGINSYHPSCANLWINCIDSELPCPI